MTVLVIVLVVAAFILVVLDARFGPRHSSKSAAASASASAQAKPQPRRSGSTRGRDSH